MATKGHRIFMAGIAAAVFLAFGCENRGPAGDFKQEKLDKFALKIKQMDTKIKRMNESHELLQKELSDLRYAVTAANEDTKSLEMELAGVQKGELVSFKTDLEDFKRVIGAVQETTVHAGWFNGVGGHLMIPARDDFNFTGDFTIELCFMKSPNSPNNFSLLKSVSSPDWNQARPGDYILTVGVDDKVYCYVKGHGNTSGNAAVSTNWHHVALVRSRNKIMQFVDGVPGGGVLDLGAPVGNTQPLVIGSPEKNLTGNYFSGWIKEIRVSSVARYTAGFTPPVKVFVPDADTRFLLHLNLNSGKEDVTSNARKSPASAV